MHLYFTVQVEKKQIYKQTNNKK